eukprot:TRINITY_DN939_c0_g2_i1.p1 TRINITY_DN939_c0_g2~~TRINITY_DN939_c0_g2_i1.p1  ORF type:complete len:722 (-),score=115.33 TRINITY_DN939_c0_g2_i1:163-2328(-)
MAGTIWSFSAIYVFFACCIHARLVTLDDGWDSGKDDAIDTSKLEVYHPEHPPFHVVRLGRFHHGGMESFMEAERKWISYDGAEERSVEAVKPEDYVQIPDNMVRALLRHQATFAENDGGREGGRGRKALLQGAYSGDHDHRKDAGRGRLGFGGAGANLVVAEDADVGAAFDSDDSNEEITKLEAEAQAEDLSRIFRGSGKPNHEATTPLHFMGSMYVGSMGVGSVLPPGCVIPPELRKKRKLSRQQSVSLHQQGATVEQLRGGKGADRRRHPWRWGTDAEAHGEDDLQRMIDGDSANVSELAEAGNIMAELAEDAEMRDTLLGAGNSRQAMMELVPGLMSNQACIPQSQVHLNVVYDTGSTNMWIASDLCTRGGCVKPGRHRFNHSESLTFAFPKKADEISVTFGTGMLQGPLGIDDLRVGPVASRQTFAMMQQQSGEIWDEIPIEGIVGLAFPSLATRDAPPFFDSVISQKVLEHNEFAFYLSRNNEASNALMWGGVDKEFYHGKIEYFPVVEAHYWALELVSFKIGNTQYFGKGRERLFGAVNATVPARFVRPAQLVQTNASSERGNSITQRPRTHVAILDTGTTFLAFPSSIWREVSSRIKARRCSRITSESHPPLMFTLRNVRGDLRGFSLKNSQYMTEDRGRCTPCIMLLDVPKEHGPGLVLGDTFLREYFSVYDRGDGVNQFARVGLARAAPTRNVSRRLNVLTKYQHSILEGRS